MPRKAQTESVSDLHAAPGGAAAVDRALSLLSCFQPGDEALTLAQFAERTQLYKSTVLRLLASLEHARLIRRQEDGRYALGAEIARLHGLYAASLSLDRIVPPVLRDAGRGHRRKRGLPRAPGPGRQLGAPVPVPGRLAARGARPRARRRPAAQRSRFRRARADRLRPRGRSGRAARRSASSTTPSARRATARWSATARPSWRGISAPVFHADGTPGRGAHADHAGAPLRRAAHRPGARGREPAHGTGLGPFISPNR